LPRAEAVTLEVYAAGQFDGRAAASIENMDSRSGSVM
jgi:hypothetical protein